MSDSEYEFRVPPIKEYETFSGAHYKIKSTVSRTPRKAASVAKKQKKRAKLKAQKRSRRKNRGR